MLVMPDCKQVFIIHTCLFSWFFFSGVLAVRLFSVRLAEKASLLGFADRRNENV
jgi:hypothetical protein